ncbi:MAG: carbohydrate kinase [Firmicutes bacterium]|nr:carbohydrate kinase [Bacillota bacterium]
MELTRFEDIFVDLPKRKILVLGDYFLDRYLEIDASLDEPSLETGLTAYQVVGIRLSPGAAGTVANNLVALGVGQVVALGVGGEDGHGLELRQAMTKGRIDASQMLWDASRVTPTYTKPMREETGQAKELNRLDFHNRTELPSHLEDELVRRLWQLAKEVDGIHVMDQVEGEGCGVVTPRVREELAAIGKEFPELPILADSRAYIGHFRGISVKINVLEAVAATGIQEKQLDEAVAAKAGAILAQRLQHPVYVTMAEKGVLVVEAGAAATATHIPAMPIPGPIDPVGAGDSVSAGIISALSTGASPVEAAIMGNVIASITIQQLGTTGIAFPSQVLNRLQEEQINIRKIS